VVIYHGVSLGKSCIIHSGTVIGSDGFGFAPSRDGWKKIHQLGAVVVGDNVEIGSNCSIDRGALGNTVIHDGVIIDNLVHIAHNVKIGKRSAIAGCVGIAGSANIGENCTVAGAVAINGHISIADNSHFHGGTIVTKGNTEAGVFASTPPMQDVKKWRRNSVRYTQLDDMANRIKQLEKQLKALLPAE
jgi:UDP-3-O-[3-hydroxymyristoyl] glucosamine N-acyltransferase